VLFPFESIITFNEARYDGWQWHQLDHMQIICTSLQTHNFVSTSPLIFYRPDALPVVMSNKQRQSTEGNKKGKGKFFP